MTTTARRSWESLAAYRFLAAAVQERLLGEEARRILPDGSD